MLRLLLLLISIHGMATPTAQAAGFVRQQGTQVVDGSGTPILLKGVNLGNWQVNEGYMWQWGVAGDRGRRMEQKILEMVGNDTVWAANFWQQYRDNYITEADIRRVRELGANHVRIPINARILMPEFGSSFDYNEFAKLDQILSWCATYGVWAILDLHCASGGQTGKDIDDSANDLIGFFVQDPGSPLTPAQHQARMVSLWGEIANRYKNNTTVIGYDLINEPDPAIQYPNELRAYQIACTNAIRAVDPNHMIVVEGSNYATQFVAGIGPPWDSNMLYEFHVYRFGSGPVLQSEIQQYIDLRALWNVPLWVGEFGEDNNNYYRATAALFESNNIGWCFWPWKKFNTWNTPYSVRLPAGWGALQTYIDGGALPGVAAAKATLTQLLQNIRIENCDYRCDVSAAMNNRLMTDPPPSPWPTPVFPPAAPACATTAIRVNCGGPLYNDSFGKAWSADKAYVAGNWGYVGGSGAGSAGAGLGNPDPTLYRTNRYGLSAYRFTVPNGTYRVEVRHSEDYWTGQCGRTYSVWAEGQVVINNIDSLGSAAPNYTYQRAFLVDVADGVLDLNFGLNADQAAVSAISVEGLQCVGSPTPTATVTPTRTVTQSHTASPTFSPTPTVTPTYCGDVVIARINSGGASFTDSAGAMWSWDQLYSSGSIANTSSPIANTPDDVLYQGNRYNPSFSYNIPAPATGTYQVRFLFAETYFTWAGARRFTVNMEGTNVITNLDIFASAGGKDIAFWLTRTATVSDGTLNILFTASADQAQVNGIEVIYKGTLCASPSPSPSSSPTGSRTATPSRTPTPSRTATPSASPSPTPTSSPTLSPTPSHSPSPSATLMGSRTATPTPSPSPSSSASATISPSGTPSHSPSPTGTLSGTRTITPTMTLSGTPSASPTQSRTHTITPTFTESVTQSFSPTQSVTPTTSPSATATNTPSPTWTQSETFTVTSSVTVSATLTDSPTQSGTPTASASPTATPSTSQTHTETATATPSVSPTQTPSASPSRTVSPTLSASPSPSATPSASPSRTVSLTRTFSPTPTGTRSPTVSVSPSPTVSGTSSVSPSRTASRTSTPTVTLSSTPAPIGTATLTVTVTPRRGQGNGPRIIDVQPVPNPQSGGILSLAVQLEGGSAEHIRLSLYTVAMTQVLRTEAQPGGPYNLGWVGVHVPWPVDLSTGLYYVRLEAINSLGTSTSRTIKLYYLGH